MKQDNSLYFMTVSLDGCASKNVCMFKVLLRLDNIFVIKLPSYFCECSQMYVIVCRSAKALGHNKHRNAKHT